MLTARGISWKQNEKLVLNNIDFQIQKGESVGIIGPNGAGKSSLLKILASLETPTEGELVFNGMHLPHRVPLEIRRKMAVVFQEPLLLNTTVYENVAAGLKIRHVPVREIRERVNFWLERFGIVGLAKQYARSLSGGEAQRVNLARAFVLEPEILFLDEPFASLDAPTREVFYKDLAKVFAQTRAATVLVSHDYREVELLTERVIMLARGEVVTEGHPQALLRNISKGELGGFLDRWLAG